MPWKSTLIGGDDLWQKGQYCVHHVIVGCKETFAIEVESDVSPLTQDPWALGSFAYWIGGKRYGSPVGELYRIEFSIVQILRLLEIEDSSIADDLFDHDPMAIVLSFLSYHFGGEIIADEDDLMDFMTFMKSWILQLAPNGTPPFDGSDILVYFLWKGHRAYFLCGEDVVSQDYVERGIRLDDDGGYRSVKNLIRFDIDKETVFQVVRDLQAHCPRRRSDVVDGSP